MIIKQKGKEKIPPEKPVVRHFTEDGKKRYCTKRPKGKDELTQNWSEVNCKRCEEKKYLEEHPEMIEKLKKKLKV